MPVRFTTPSLGGQGELQVADLAAHQWRIALGYRHLHADQLFVGTQLLPTSQPLIINLHSVDVTTSYAVTDRFSLSLTVPFVDGMQSTNGTVRLRLKRSVTAYDVVTSTEWRLMMSGWLVGSSRVPTNNWSAWRWRYPS